jgi:hypothetical protein
MTKNVRDDMNKLISELEQKGIRVNSHKLPNDKEGLGDIVESALTKLGITEQRFKDFFGLKECNCTKRKQWLNGLFSWHKTKNK